MFSEVIPSSDLGLYFSVKTRSWTMVAIHLSAVIPETRTLVIQLPPDTPTGPAELEIRPTDATVMPTTNPAREAARAKLLAAGRLVTSIHAPEGTPRLSPEEILKIGQLPPDARPSHELIDEDRGEW
jgi:hypothetical protein